jgi:hypothetical protein
MNYIDIILIIIGAICYLQYDELNRNNIRGDETKYAVLLFIVILALLTSILTK